MSVLPKTNGELRQMLQTAAEAGASLALKKAGLVKLEISKAEAYRRYSKRKIDNWVNTGQLSTVCRKNRQYIAVAELEQLAAINDLYGKCTA